MLVSSLKDEAEGFISGPLIAACCFHLLSLFPSVVHLTIHLPTLSWSWPGQTGRKVISDEEFARRAWKKRPACGDSVWKSKRLWWIGASAQGVCGASWGINKVGVSQKPNQSRSQSPCVANWCQVLANVLYGFADFFALFALHSAHSSFRRSFVNRGVCFNCRPQDLVDETSLVDHKLTEYWCRLSCHQLPELRLQLRSCCVCWKGESLESSASPRRK